LDVLPEVAKESCFALHGGTAINLFVRNMPRLSVDIDLTYLPVEDRDESLRRISAGLKHIGRRIETVVPGVKVTHTEHNSKLLITRKAAVIKLEVNLTHRGTLESPKRMSLSEKVQSEFDVFCAVPIVPVGQLYGGKICAALYRQHPRDLFDVKYLFENEGFTNEIKTGFLLCLLGSDRPIHEAIQPKFQDQRQAMENQFSGMTAEEFDYEDFESTRVQLVETINNSLTKTDKEFLMSVADGEPNWKAYDFEKFPSVRWKMLNFKILKDTNPEKHKKQLEILRTILKA
jgi:predicted nucleotidyltransferase component of viral defense system